MIWTLGLAVLFLALFAIEWWFASRIVHVLAVGASVALLLFSRPMPYRALRRAVEMSPVTHNLWRPEKGATPFQSGIFTMYEAITRDIAMNARERGLALSALTWLTISPFLWRRRSSGGTQSGSVVTVSG
jgi:hypothetical protein